MFVTSKKAITFFLLFSLLFLCAKSQSVLSVDSLKEKVKLYGQKKQSAVLFIHFDKTIYTNNDNVWFTAYIHKAINISRYKTLSLMLVNDADRSIIIQDKFVIDKGKAFGNAVIPDSARAGNYTFVAYTNNMVDGHLDVVFTQPITIKLADNAAANTVKATIKQAVETTTNVRFYPESGSMVNGLGGLIGWEARDSAGFPRALTAFLYDGDAVIDTIETDLAGRGTFMLKPVYNHNYYLKLYKGGNAIYKLPAVPEKGAAISLKKAVVDDSLVVDISNATYQKLSLICHNYANTFFIVPASAAAKSTVTLSLRDVPKGLTQLTLVDSVGRPYAERTFFAHNSKKVTPMIFTDKTIYSNRQKVNVKIQLKGISDTGKISIACVEEKRIELKKHRKIDEYFYFENDLEDTNADAVSMESELLIKGWKRYTWADALQTRAADTAHVYDHIEFKGKVYRNDSQLKQPVTLINLNKATVKITTLNNGVFSLKDSDLVSSPGKKINFVVDQRNNKQYRVFLLDPYIEINDKLKDRLRPQHYTGVMYNNYMPLPANSGTILKEVNIKARTGKGITANICGDFVCRYGVLNCGNHRYESDNRPAVKGEVYFIHGREDNYSGCGGVSESGFTGINEAAEFYPADYEMKSPVAADYVSTIFWKHQLKISPGDEAVVSFFTSDITGKFKIIVQGTVGNDVTYGETSFEVISNERKQ